MHARTHAHTRGRSGVGPAPPGARRRVQQPAHVRCPGAWPPLLGCLHRVGRHSATPTTTPTATTHTTTATTTMIIDLPAPQAGGRVTAVAAVEDDASIASASANGTIHVWRVDAAWRRPGAGGGADKYYGACAGGGERGARWGVPCSGGRLAFSFAHTHAFTLTTHAPPPVPSRAQAWWPCGSWRPAAAPCWTCAPGART